MNDTPKPWLFGVTGIIGVDAGHGKHGHLSGGGGRPDEPAGHSLSEMRPPRRPWGYFPAQNSLSRWKGGAA